jgi:hypothetical protein
LLGPDLDFSKFSIAISGMVINVSIRSRMGQTPTAETCLNGTARSGSSTGKVPKAIGGEASRKLRKIG